MCVSSQDKTRWAMHMHTHTHMQTKANQYMLQLLSTPKSGYMIFTGDMCCCDTHSYIQNFNFFFNKNKTRKARQLMRRVRARGGQGTCFLELREGCGGRGGGFFLEPCSTQLASYILCITEVEHAIDFLYIHII